MPTRSKGLRGDDDRRFFSRTNRTIDAQVTNSLLSRAPMMSERIQRYYENPDYDQFTNGAKKSGRNADHFRSSNAIRSVVLPINHGERIWPVRS